jgi:hypothetical protein
MAKLTCKDCGQVKQATAKRYNRLLEEFGGEGALKANYLCMACRTKDNPPKAKPAKKEAIEEQVLKTVNEDDLTPEDDDE